MNENTIPEREANMGYTLAREVAERSAVLALSMGKSDEAVVIPDTDGQVLVRNGSLAFLKRKDDLGIFKIPAVLKTIVDGAEKEETFFVCTR